MKEKIINDISSSLKKSFQLLINGKTFSNFRKYTKINDHDEIILYIFNLQQKFYDYISKNLRLNPHDLENE